MSWDYQYTVGSLVLADVTDGVVIEGEGGSSLVDGGYQIHQQDGVAFDPRAVYGPLDVTLKTVISYTDPSGNVTHPDGGGGHFVENLSAIKAAFAGGDLKALGRTAADIGAVRAMCRKVATVPGPSAERHVYRWILTVPSGSWEDATESEAAASAVVTAGDRRIADPTIVFASAATLTHTAADGTISEVTAEAGASYPLTVFRSDGKWRVTDSGGNDARGSVTWSQPWVLRMDPDGAQSFTGSATIRWRNKWE